MNTIVSFFRKGVAYVWGLPKLYSIPAGLLIVGVLLVGEHYLTRPAALPEAPASVTHVQLATVLQLASQTGPLPVTGTVTSQSKASILAQASGEVVSLPRSIGDRVAAGQVIGQFENSAQQAAVLQAEGAYDAAEVALAKASGTTAQNSSITSATAQQSAADARISATTALQSAFSALDDAVHAKADLLFSNADGPTPKFLPTIPDSQLALNAQNKRSTLGGTLDAAQALSNVGPDTDVAASITAMTQDAQAVLSFLNDVVAGANQAQPNQYISAATIATDQAAAAAARTQVVAAISALTTAKSAYTSAVSSAATASNSASSASGNDIAAAQASLKSAQGALNAAKAALEKTIIRSPISGVIVSLSITRGDYVSAYTQVAQISNPGALYLDVYVTPDDAKTLSVGNKVHIEKGASGVITFIASAIDPTTGKIEVKVGITAGERTLTDGEVVTASLERTQAAAKADTAGQITLPIQALKMTPEGPVVFSVSTSSALVSHAITLGSILGERVVVLSGITPDLQIVTDARGLAEGEVVATDAD